MSASFQVGTSYSTTSACDSECVFTWTVTARNGQMLTLENKRGELSRRKVTAAPGGEFCFPSGKFSMAPMIQAQYPDAE